MHLSGERTVGPNTPMLRPPKFLELLQPLQLLLAPRRVRGNSQSLPDDLVDFVAKKELVHRELSLRMKRSDSFIANFEEGCARDRVLVDLDLIFHKQIVLVLQRSWCGLIHLVGSEVMRTPCARQG